MAAEAVPRPFPPRQRGLRPQGQAPPGRARQAEQCGRPRGACVFPATLLSTLPALVHQRRPRRAAPPTVPSAFGPPLSLTALRGLGEPRPCVPAAPPFRAWSVGPRGLAALHAPLLGGIPFRLWGAADPRWGRVPERLGSFVRGTTGKKGLSEGCARRGTAAHATFSCVGRLLNFPLGCVCVGGFPLRATRAEERPGPLSACKVLSPSRKTKKPLKRDPADRERKRLLLLGVGRDEIWARELEPPPSPAPLIREAQIFEPGPSRNGWDLLRDGILEGSDALLAGFFL